MQISSLRIPARYATAALILAAVALTVLSVFSLLISPRDAAAQPREFTVQQGWGGGRIASELKDAGLIRSVPAFVILANWTGTGDTLKAGTYLLSPSMSVREMLQMLAVGEALSTDISVTVPEGMNSWEIDELLAERGLILKGSFARRYRDSEGGFFPDTYRFAASVASGSRAYDDAKIFADAFRSGFLAKARRFTSEQIIIASMLEKEAKTPRDMALVAGIIARRRELDMPFQIDATVAYGWCLARWLPMSSTANCDVTQAPIALEIKKDGPYNTYARKGLPIGPISNPGMKALDAAAHPAKSDYLYYLSTRDGSELIYSKTLSEHLANRRKYLGF